MSALRVPASVPTLDALAAEPTLVDTLPPGVLREIYARAARLEADLRARILTEGGMMMARILERVGGCPHDVPNLGGMTTPPHRPAGRRPRTPSRHGGEDDGVEKLLTVKEAASVLSCSEAAIRKWVHQGRLPIVKAGRLVRVPQRNLEEFVRAQSSALRATSA